MQDPGKRFAYRSLGHRLKEIAKTKLDHPATFRRAVSIVNRRHGLRGGRGRMVVMMLLVMIRPSGGESGREGCGQGRWMVVLDGPRGWESGGERGRAKAGERGRECAGEPMMPGWLAAGPGRGRERTKAQRPRARRERRSQAHIKTERGTHDGDDPQLAHF